MLLLVGILGTHPQLSRREAIDAAMSQQLQQTRQSDLERAASRSGENIGQDTSPDHFIWVIAVSGDYAIRGEYMGGPPATWTILVVNDQRPAQLSATWGGGQGNWPPFFDGLNGLS
ncbi:MAG: hypothetical protein E6I24_05955 [Chloroflexi bacterium]|nr:MAG: hypothetical protein E6I24_05955 [Chloroflexota bacterium]